MKEGWDIKRLGEIAEIEYGYTDKAVSIGDYRYIRITDIDKDGLLSNNEKVYINSNDEAKSFLLSNGDLLMARIGATFAKVLFYQGFEPSVFASYLIRIKFKHQVYNKFYWYFSKSTNYWEQAIELSSGAAQPQFNGNALKQILFTFPKSFSEQQRIVSILDQAFAAIDKAKANAEQNLKNAKALFESYLQGVFEKKGDGWEEKTLKSIGITQTGTTPKTTNKNNYGDFIPFIKPADIDIFGNGEIRYDNEGLSEEGLSNGRKILQGSILMVCIGASIGKVGFTDRDVSSNQQINALTVNTGLHPKFFYYALRTKGFYNQVIINSSQATLPLLIKSKWEILKVNFPISYSEQKSIVQKLDALSIETKRLEAIYQQKINNLEDLKNSILDKAFKGEL